MPRFILSNAALVLALVVSTSSFLPAEETVPLSSLDLHKMKQGWGEAKIDQSVTGKPLVIGGQTFAHGVGTHAVSVFYVQLGGGTRRFTAKVGVDSSQKGKPGSVEFRVIADGKTLFKSGVMRPGDAAKTVDVDLSGVKTLLLFVGSAGDGIDFDHADWADAKFVVSGEKPKAVDAPREEARHSHAQAFAQAADQRAGRLWLSAGKSVYLSDSHHRPAADQFCGRESAGRPAAWMPARASSPA